MRRTVIPPSLRPHVLGSVVEDSTHNPRPSIRYELGRRICIMGSGSDPVIKWIKEYLEKQNIIYLYYDLDLCTDVMRAINDILDLIRSDLDKINIFLRPFAVDDVSLNNAIGVLIDIIECYKGLVINRISCDITNSSKPQHYVQIMKEVSKYSEQIFLPETYISSNFSSNFFNAQNTSLIVKSISAVRSNVQRADDLLLVDGREYNSIHMFQSMIAGTTFRIHVIGDKCIPLIANSALVDYRLDEDVSFSFVEIPRDIENLCILLTKSEGLVFSGIDMIRDHNGFWYVLEVNPTPAYNFFEDRLLETKNTQPISQAILGLLLEPQGRLP